MNEFWFHCKVFLKGLFDSLSFHRTLRILVNDSTIALLTAQILLTNLFLLVGSHFLYHNGITPVLQFLNDSKSLFQYQETYSVPNSTDSIAWFLFKALWLLPVCLICYGCSTVWYQELADCTYKYLKGNQKSSPSKDAAYVIYGTLIWLFLYLQVQILTAITPMVCDNLQPYTDLFFSRVEDSYNHSSYPLFTWTSSMLRLLSLHAVKLLSFFLQVYGYLLMSLLYGWYAFDPQWIAANVDPDARCGLMERHWAYFVGFGSPYVLLLKSTSFFVGFGTFLALFPFCIMLGSLSSYSAPYHPDPDPTHVIANADDSGGGGRVTQQRKKSKSEKKTESNQDSSGGGGGGGKGRATSVSSGGSGSGAAVAATVLPLFSVARGLTWWTLRFVRRSVTSSSASHHPPARVGQEKGKKD